MVWATNKVRHRTIKAATTPRRPTRRGLFQPQKAYRLRHTRQAAFGQKPTFPISLKLVAVVRASTREVFEWHIFVGNTLCGSVQLKDIDEQDRKAKIGYFIAREFSGRGIVTSAVHTVLAYCFKELNYVPLLGMTLVNRLQSD